MGRKEGRETTEDYELRTLTSLHNTYVPQNIPQTGWEMGGHVQDSCRSTETIN